MVSPTMSGIIIEALDQVRMTDLLELRCALLTFLASLASTNGPFLMDLDIQNSRRYRWCLRRTMNRSDLLFFRVRYPRAGLPHGVFGPGIPIGERPSPPP